MDKLCLKQPLFANWNKGIETQISNPDISATQCCRPWLFQTMNSNRSDNLSLKNQRFTSSDE